MENTKGYKGIDCFRIIAAVLVVAIHTAPLESINGTADFILCDIAARVAVPFFLMASGFFLFKDNVCSGYKIASFVKKLLVIYAAAIIFYIPVNIYNGYLGQEQTALDVFKDIIFNGTMYHLWYLPAAMLGVLIAWGLIKRLGKGGALAAALGLYIIGLFGDSYYGVISGINVIRHLYDAMFNIFDYTRNGIFFVPVFFVMSAVMAQGKRLSFKYSIAGLITCLAGMIGEGLILRSLEWQRHTSMYVMLLPCMFFLFSLLCHMRGKRQHLLSKMAMVIYIIHPMVIVAVRLFAKLLHTEKWFVENSLIHFTLVLVLSAGASLGILYIIHFVKTFKRKASETDRAWMEINLKNLRHNVNELKSIMPEGCKLMAVVKSDAYGHGAVKVSGFLNRIGVYDFAVATIDEGIELRKNNVAGKILIFGHTDISRVNQLKKYELTQTITDLEYAKKLNNCKKNIMTQIKLDTGMHRAGLNAEDIDSISEIFSLRHIRVDGIYTHLCTADSLEEQDEAFAKGQINLFFDTIDKIKDRGINIPKIHIQSSYGLLNYPEVKCDYARIGIAMYGVLSSYGDYTRVSARLKPVMAVRSRIVQIRGIKEGETVGYGRTFLAARDSRIAVISIGYADGIPRELSCGNEFVIIRGQKAPVIGRICMDVMEADVTEIENAAEGDVVTIIGNDGDESISAEEIALSAGTITNELLSRMGVRLKRKYIDT